MNFEGKKILITGATGGIGNNLVKRFIELKAKVCATGTNSEKLEILKKNYNNVLTKKFSLSEHEKIEEFIEEVDKDLGGLDVLVNNAGVNQDNISLRLSEQDWKKVIDINLTSTFLMSKYSIKKMIKQKKRGKVINITSVVGHTGNFGQSNYSASKAGIIGFSKSLALEYAKKQININCISPGFIKTDMTEKIDQKFRDLIISKIPSGDLGTPEDVSNCAVFLASDMSNYITGETLHVNGGMYMS